MPHTDIYALLSGVLDSAGLGADYHNLDQNN